jgi:hypothetical protein
MKKFFVFLIVLLTCGCSNIVPASMSLGGTTLRHESFEDSLLTEAEFKERVSQAATQVYEGLSDISDAAKLYAIDNDDRLPTGGSGVIRALLLDGGYLSAWPEVPAFAFTDPEQGDFKYSDGYTDMDGVGAFDDVIYAQDLKIEVCEDLTRRFSSLAPDDSIHDYEAAGGRYPGQTIGTHMKLYAITWSKTWSWEYCDIEWVMKYNGRGPKKVLPTSNIIR